MLVYLLYMLVFLAKEEQILNRQVRPEYIMFHIRVRNNFLLFHSFSFSFPQPPGLPSTQSVGPVHLSSLAPTGPVLIPSHSGVCQHPLPSLFAAHW